MKKHIFFTAVILTIFSLSSRAQQAALAGKWETPKKDIVEFYADGQTYTGKQISAETENNKKNNDKVVAKDLKPAGAKVFEGTVLDPNSGKTYHGGFTINESGSQLELKIKWGFLSHNETWKRVN